MIKHIRIRNFRSLVDVSIDLDRLTVLIGRSGTGKTNFVNAVRFLRDCLSSRQINLDSLGGIHRVLHVDHHRDALAYDLTFSISGLDREFRYRLSFSVPNDLDESLAVGNQVLFHQAAGRWQLPPQVVPAPHPSGIMLGAIPGLQESTFAYVALRSGIGCYDFPGEVFAGGNDQGNHPADQGFADRGGNYLLVADRILSDLSKAQSWTRIAKGMRAVNRDTVSLTLNAPVPDRLDVGHQLNGRLLTFDVRQESEGFRQFLAHLLALYQNPSKQTLIFEHPEAAIHPGAFQALAEEFKDCPEDGRGQVILTTHSPQLLDAFPVDSIRVVDIDHQRTRIGPLAPEQLRAVKEHLLLPGELLTVDPARLEGQLDGVPG
jgi:predicted ATPase